MTTMTHRHFREVGFYVNLRAEATARHRLGWILKSGIDAWALCALGNGILSARDSTRGKEGGMGSGKK